MLSWHPPVGVYIAILAFLGVLVPLFRDLTRIGKPEKAAWTLLLFLLVGLEIKSIYQDRDEHEREQARARSEQTERFAQIADGLTTALINSDKQFKTTMAQFGEVIGSTQHVAVLARESVENITGGDSFGFAVPQNFAATTFPLRVWNHGNHPLMGVSMTITNTTNDPNWGAGFYQPIYLGNIGPHDSVPVPGVLITPRPEPKSGQDSYWIFISAQNGTVSQSLYFRKHKNPKIPWAYSYLVTKNETLEQPKGPIPKGATFMQPILHKPWSDDASTPH